MSSDPSFTFGQTYKSVLFWEALPHLYFLGLKYFMLVFGYSTLNARIFSAIIGLFGVYAMYLLGKAIYNRRSGLIAAAITCVSVFHITYSQEARPYGMLFLFTVLSYYRLILFVRNPTMRTALIYGVFSGLIINSHFFGILTIGAQALLLLLILFKQDASDRMKFLRLCFASAGVILILALPNIEALLHVAQIKSFWILQPGPEAFTNMFKEFFGNAELLMFVINVLIIYYLFSVFRQKLVPGIKNFNGNRLILSFFVLCSWLVVSLVISMLKSYLDVSMILSRYFINILPVFIIATAIGAARIRNAMVRNTIVGCLVVFSLIDLVVVRDYYNRPSKCQMREMTTALKAANTNNAKIVTFYSWIYPFWFKDQPETKFESKSFDDYVTAMRANEIGHEPFWYSNINPYALSEVNEKYLKEHFIRTKKLEYFDCWAYYYKPKKNSTQDGEGEISLKIFKTAKFSDKGITFNQSGSYISPPLDFKNGQYEMILSGSSAEKTHFKIKANGNEIADFFWEGENQQQKITFDNLKQNKVRFQIIFDNGATQRTAVISDMKLNMK
nr:glycosyltransferase family 39 protein [Flavobacterium sp.]